jgi:hypothetical protein
MFTLFIDLGWHRGFGWLDLWGLWPELWENRRRAYCFFYVRKKKRMKKMRGGIIEFYFIYFFRVNFRQNRWQNIYYFFSFSIPSKISLVIIDKKYSLLFMSEIIDGIFFVSVFVVICQFSGNDFDNCLIIAWKL